MRIGIRLASRPTLLALCFSLAAGIAKPLFAQDEDNSPVYRQAFADYIGEVANKLNAPRYGGALRSLQLILNNVSNAQRPCQHGVGLLEAVFQDTREPQPSGTGFALYIARLFGTALTAANNAERGEELALALRSNPAALRAWRDVMVRLRAECASDIWSTDYGSMTLPKSLTRNFSGLRVHYTEDSGRIIASYTASTRELTGFWIEAGSSQECESEKDGSLHWGGVTFTFNAEFNSFDGVWGYCTDAMSSSWNGTRP
jgi:hypothetical protein